MANNLFADVPAAVVARQTIDFAAAGFDSNNTRIIFEVGSPLKSWVPGRAINSVSGFTEGKGYYIVAKTDMDMEALIAPPLPAGMGTPTTSIEQTGNVIDFTHGIQTRTVSAPVAMTSISNANLGEEVVLLITVQPGGSYALNGLGIVWLGPNVVQEGENAIFIKCVDEDPGGKYLGRIEQYQPNTAPVLQNLTVTPNAGFTQFTAGFNYYDADGDPENTGAREVQWYSADDENKTNPVAIAGATNLVYNKNGEDWLFVRIRPYAQTGVLQGVWHESAVVNAGAFQFADAPGYTAEYSAASTTKTGADIDTFVDLSGNAEHLLPLGTKAVDSTDANGKKYININAANQARAYQKLFDVARRTAQPFNIYIVLKPTGLSESVVRYVTDGFDVDNRAGVIINGNDTVSIYAGSMATGVATLVEAQLTVLRLEFNGVNSKIYINNVLDVSGVNPGAHTFDGLTILGNWNNSSSAYMHWYHQLVYFGTHSDQDATNIYNKLVGMYSA